MCSPTQSTNHLTEKNLLELIQFLISVMPSYFWVPILVFLWFIWTEKNWPKFCVAVPDGAGERGALCISESSSSRPMNFHFLCISLTPFSVYPDISPKLWCAIFSLSIDSSGHLTNPKLLEFHSHARSVLLIPLPTTWDGCSRLLFRPKIAHVKRIRARKKARVISPGVSL